MGHMAQVAKHHELGAANVARKPFTKLQREARPLNDEAAKAIGEEEEE